MLLRFLNVIQSIMRSEACEIGHAKAGRFLTWYFKTGIRSCKPHSCCSVIDPDEHGLRLGRRRGIFVWMRSIVTGGAGFIGSHIVDHLVAQGDEVVVIDALLAGDLRFISKHLDSGAVKFVRANLLEPGWQDACAGADRVWHIAADPDVRESAVTPDAQLNNTIIATHRVLEAIRTHKIPEIVFHINFYRVWRSNHHPNTGNIHTNGTGICVWSSKTCL